MRVLFVNPGLVMGGAEQSLLLLLQGLQAYGVEATVALFGDGPFREPTLGHCCFHRLCEVIWVAPERNALPAVRGAAQGCCPGDGGPTNYGVPGGSGPPDEG